MMENIHSEAYSLMIDALVTNKSERQALFDGIRDVPSIKRKAELCLRWMGTGDEFSRMPITLQKAVRNLVADADREKLDVTLNTVEDWMHAKTPTFGERLVAFACVEGISFSSSFAFIYWLKSRGLMPGICFGNELISRDEGQHQTHGAETKRELEAMHWEEKRAKEEGRLDELLATYREQRCLGELVPPDRVLQIVREFVEAEHFFIDDYLRVALVGINADKMRMYVEFVANRLLVQLGCEKHYAVRENPLPYAEGLALEDKANFFERRVSSYQRRGVKKTEQSKALNTFRIDAPF
jgi:ribonucleotide reductase beta subunit family protein with ferritin-like domain